MGEEVISDRACKNRCQMSGSNAATAQQIAKSNVLLSKKLKDNKRKKKKKRKKEKKKEKKKKKKKKKRKN